MKTAKQWFLDVLPIEISSLAISNTSNLKLITMYDNFNDAICGSFIWMDSPQGLDYWIEISWEYNFKKNV